MRALLFGASLLVACSCGSAAPSAASPSRTGAATAAATSAASGTRYGVAGLVAPHAPSPKAADHEALYTSLATTGGAVGVYTNWSDPGDREGQVPAVIPATVAAASKYRFGPLVIALGVARDADGTVRSTVDWSSAQRDRFVAVATAVARDVAPEYLALGVESNRLWAADPAAFDGFVKGYADAYDAIKKVSPRTKVFTIFQLELMKGHAARWTGVDNAPQWDLLQRFAGRLDLAGFTTYPFLQYARPADVPADYYADAAARVGGPLAFTEIGWPSRAIVGAPFGYEATPASQAAFVERFFALTAATKPALALWSFPYELGVETSVFDSVALRTSDGAAKPALDAWQAGIGTK